MIFRSKATNLLLEYTYCNLQLIATNTPKYVNVSATSPLCRDNLSLKVHSHRTKLQAKAKIYSTFRIGVAPLNLT